MSHTLLMSHLNFETYFLNDGCILGHKYFFTVRWARCLQLESRRTQFPKKVDSSLFCKSHVHICMIMYCILNYLSTQSLHLTELFCSIFYFIVVSTFFLTFMKMLVHLKVLIDKNICDAYSITNSNTAHFQVYSKG